MNFLTCFKLQSNLKYAFIFSLFLKVYQKDKKNNFVKKII